jgi:hypothetical protein
MTKSTGEYHAGLPENSKRGTEVSNPSEPNKLYFLVDLTLNTMLRKIFELRIMEWIQIT